MPPKGSKAAPKQPKASAKAAVSSSATCFLDALIVPALAQACGRALDNSRDGPGAGLKKLRSVSKGVSTASNKAVQGLTLQLGDKAPVDLPGLVRFLQKCQLSQLRIEVSATTAEVKEDANGKQAAAEEVASQISSFCSNVSSALRSITHLTITLPPSHSCDAKETPATKAADATLLPLAAACPLLQRLTISGKIRPSILAGFGSSCPKLSCLEVVFTNLAPSTLKLLPTLLPHLTSLVCLPPPPPPPFKKISKGSKQPKVDPDGAICTALKACPHLLSFDTGAYAMNSTIWNALPTGLISLACTLPSSDAPDKKWPAHANLRRLELNGGCWDIASLVMLLAAAPQLTSLHLRSTSSIVVALSRADAKNLKRLDDRMSAGLAVSGTQTAWNKVPGLCKLALYFTVKHGERPIKDTTSEHYEHRMLEFVASHMLPLLNITEVEFCNSEGRNEPAGSLAELPRLLPNIERLTVDNLDLYSFNVQSLIACKKLRELTFMTVDGFDGKALRTLCAKSKCLREVKLCGCRGITLEDEKAIKGSNPEGCWYGRLGAVRVLIERGDFLEEEDFKRESFWAQTDSDDSDDDSDRKSSDIYDY